jgi:hypothetical protein
LITIGDGTDGANDVYFEFARMNGRTFATANAGTLAVDFLAGAADITTLQAKAPGITVPAGVTVNLVNV